MEAVRGTGCVIRRWGREGRWSACAGELEFSHLEKSGHAKHHWTRAVCKCTQHHAEYEGTAASWCKRYNLTFDDLEDEAQQFVEWFGHLVPAKR